MLVNIYINCENATDIKWLNNEPLFSILVRLINGPNAWRGTLQIFYAGHWGTICDNAWDNNDASVVCRQLGFYNGGKALINLEYGEGTGEILMNEVNCNGSESKIINCSASTWLYHTCSHGDDAGVSCHHV